MWDRKSSSTGACVHVRIIMAAILALSLQNYTIILLESVEQ